MIDNTKISEQFHYFNIQSKIDSVYGNWAVSTKGDVVNYLFPYVIFAIHLNDTDWMNVLKQKCWFLPECEVNLREAIRRAEEIKMLNDKVINKSSITK